MSTDAKNDDALHPIRVVAERTGITPHVLRAWERRFGVVSPTRSEGGQRFYSDSDIHRLTLLLKALQAGRSISQVASLPNSELAIIVADDANHGRPSASDATVLRAHALDAVRDLAPDRLQLVLRRGLLSLGTPVFLEGVLAPLLEEIGEEWHKGHLSIAHEHAASAAVQQLLGWLIAAFDVANDAPSVLLATPAGQRHSQGAMMAAAAASHDGWHVIWLGADLPAAQIATAAQSQGVHLVGLSVSTMDNRVALRSEVTELRSALNANTPLFVGGRSAGELGTIDGVGTMRDLTHWRSVLRTHAPARLTS